MHESGVGNQINSRRCGNRFDVPVFFCLCTRRRRAFRLPIPRDLLRPSIFSPTAANFHLCWCKNFAFKSSPAHAACIESLLAHAGRGLHWKSNFCMGECVRSVYVLVSFITECEAAKVVKSSGSRVFAGYPQLISKDSSETFAGINSTWKVWHWMWLLLAENLWLENGLTATLVRHLKTLVIRPLTSSLRIKQHTPGCFKSEAMNSLKIRWMSSEFKLFESKTSVNLIQTTIKT